jgi:DNA-binding GntR family transcriptional regulator
MSAPYLRIVDEIRGRIVAGQLRPGDRVPSARQITQDWGVAIATATKALAALQADGLVRAIVGVGTVVAETPPPATPLVGPLRTNEGPAHVSARESEAELSQDRIVRTAIAIADAEGLSAVTMRRLGTELRVPVMSLYRHVPSKDDLVVLMVDRIFGEAMLPETRLADWRAQLETVARLQWALVRRHPWMPSVMSLTRPMMVPNGMAHTEWTMRVVHELGFDLPTSLHVAVVMAGFLLGMGTSAQMEADAERETGLRGDEWTEEQDEAFARVNVNGRFTMLEAVGDVPEFEMRLDDLFELGLKLILDGFAAMVAARGAGDDGGGG